MHKQTMNKEVPNDSLKPRLGYGQVHNTLKPSILRHTLSDFVSMSINAAIVLSSEVNTVVESECKPKGRIKKKLPQVGGVAGYTVVERQKKAADRSR